MKTWSHMRIVCLLALCMGWPGVTCGATRWALLIGVNQYPKGVASKGVRAVNGVAHAPNINWPDLKFAVIDIRGLRDALLNVGYERSHVVVLDSDATEAELLPTYDNIVRQISALANDSRFQKDDSIMIVFTGHGFTLNGESLLCPSNIDVNNLKGSGIPVSWISDQLAQANVAQRYLVIDACRNEVTNIGGSQFNLLTGLQRLALQKRSSEEPTEAGAPQGIFYFASCLAGQRSVEDPHLGHGVFLHFFTEGLRGAADVQAGGDRNRFVSPYEAFRFAADETRRWTRKSFSWEQQPWVEGRSTDGLHLSEIPMDKHQELLSKVPTWESTAPSAFTLQAQYDLELGILALHGGDRAEAERRVDEALKFDPTNPLARQTRSLLYLMRSGQQTLVDEDGDAYEDEVANPDYVQALKQMQAIDRPLLIRASADIPLLKEHETVTTARRGDVLIGSRIIDFGNKKWFEVSGIQRKSQAATNVEKLIAFVSLETLAAGTRIGDQVQEFDSRNQQPGYLMRGGYDGAGDSGRGGEAAVAALQWVNFGLGIRGGTVSIPNISTRGGGGWRGFVPYGGRFW